MKATGPKYKTSFTRILLLKDLWSEPGARSRSVPCCMSSLCPEPELGSPLWLNICPIKVARLCFSWSTLYRLTLHQFVSCLGCFSFSWAQNREKSQHAKLQEPLSKVCVESKNCIQYCAIYCKHWIHSYYIQILLLNFQILFPAEFTADTLRPCRATAERLSNQDS